MSIDGQSVCECRARKLNCTSWRSIWGVDATSLIVVAAMVAAILCGRLCRAQEVDFRDVFAEPVPAVAAPQARPPMPVKPVAPSASSVVAIARNPSQASWVETATGTTSDDHLIRVHGYTPEQIRGLSQAEKNRLHGYAHERGHAPRSTVSHATTPPRPGPAYQPVYQQPVRSACPGGVCPLQIRRRR